MKIEKVLEKYQAKLYLETEKIADYETSNDVEIQAALPILRGVKAEYEIVVDALEKQIPKPTNMDHCQCGMAIDVGWLYCPSCGQCL